MKNNIYTYGGNNKISKHNPRKLRHINYALFLIINIVLAVALVFINNIIILALVIAVIFTFVIFKYPAVGLALFIALNFLRPSDLMPSLESLPLAKVIGGVTLFAILIKYIHSKYYIYNYRQTYLLFAFIGVLFVSIPMSFWPSESSRATMEFIKMILFYLIFINICRDFITFRRMTLLALVCVIFLCISTIQSYFSGVERAGATIGAKLFGDANDAALLFVTILPFSFLWIMGNKFRLGKYLFAASVAILIIGIILTQSRGGFIGLLAILFVFISHGKNKIKAIIILAVIALLIQIILPSKISERYSTIGTYQEDASAIGRINAWKAGFSMMMERPFVGVGIGCFPVAYGTLFGSSGRWMAPHNTFVQVGAETGFIGLAIFVYLIIYCLLQLNKIRSDDPRNENEEIFRARDMVVASFTGFVICACFLTQALNFVLYYLIASTVAITFIFNNIRADKLKLSR